MKTNGMLLLAGLAVVAGASAARADVPWANPNGSTSQLSYDNGRSTNGLFGDPVVIGDTFFFIANANFDAQAFNGNTVTTSDTLKVNVHALGGRAFTQVIFSSSGDYTVFGAGSSADVTGNMTVEDLNSARNGSDSFHTSVSPTLGSATAFPVNGNNTTPELGTWTGFSLIDFTTFGAPPVTDIFLTFTNNLVAISNGTQSAVIATLPQTQGSFSLRIVPAPSAGVAGLMGLAMVSRRRRR